MKQWWKGLREWVAFFVAGSPMAPATEISEVLSMKLSQVDGKFVQMEDGVTLGTDPQC
ncbi:MAG: hypothetical protein MUP41_10265 [Desulfobacterales bacterium]|nr:hypothetical protein [Desulfobacterales bacterium]